MTFHQGMASTPSEIQKVSLPLDHKIDFIAS
jgi:hypothetical protein